MAKTSVDEAKLDELQRAYKKAVDEWKDAIEAEEELASVHHSVAQLDRWEKAHFHEEELRSKAIDAKKKYEEALRKDIFGF